MILSNIIVKTKFEWDILLNKFKNKDIYFEYDFLNLYSNEGSKPMLIYMETENAKMAYPFMLMDISFHENFKGILECGKYFDISTFYGYSGYLIEADDDDSKFEIIELFYKNFGDFCSEYNIVSEFIKFSPFIKEYECMANVIKILPYKQIAITNIENYGNKLCNEIKSTRLKAVEKCIKLGMETQIILNPKSFDKQLEIYYATMDRKHANKNYYYSREYFDKMLDSYRNNVLLINVLYKDEIIAFGLCLIYDKYIHAIVSGVDSNYLKYSPSSVHYLETIKWGFENGYKFFLSGGGLTCDKNDSLYLYKKSFAQKSNNDLYVLNKIWNKDTYEYLLSLIGFKDNSHNKYFPLYRLISPKV